MSSPLRNQNTEAEPLLVDSSTRNSRTGSLMGENNKTNTNSRESIESGNNLRISIPGNDNTSGNNNSNSFLNDNNNHNNSNSVSALENTVTQGVRTTLRGIYSDSSIPNRRGCTIEFNDISIVHTPTVAESLSTWWHSSWWWKTLWSLDSSSDMMIVGPGGNALSPVSGNPTTASLFTSSSHRTISRQHALHQRRSKNTNTSSTGDENNNSSSSSSKSLLCCSMEPFIVVRSAVGLFDHSQIHAICAPSFDSTDAVIDTIIGEKTPTEGTVTVNGEKMPVHFRLHCGIVDQRASWSFDNLTVRENLMFAARMRRPTQDTDIFEERSSYLSRLFHLDVATKAEKLSVMMRLRLEIAMELMVDPAVLIVVHPFENLDRHSHSQLSNTLIVAASILQKTVIVTMSSLPLTLVPALDSVLLLGGDDGHCLYSGSRHGLFQYFTKLQLPPLITHKAKVNSTRQKSNNSKSTNNKLPKNASVDNNNDSFNSKKNNKNNRLSATARSNPTLLNATPAESTRGSNNSITHAPTTPTSGTAIGINMMMSNHSELPVFDENTADNVIDQVAAWGNSPMEMNRYASRFYDSDERRSLIEAISKNRKEGAKAEERQSLSRMGSQRTFGNNNNNNSTTLPRPGSSDTNNNHELATNDSVTGANNNRDFSPRNDNDFANDNNDHSASYGTIPGSPAHFTLAHHSGNNNSNQNNNNNNHGKSAYEIFLSKPEHPRNAFMAWTIALFYYIYTSLKSALSYVETYIYWVCLMLVLVFCAWLLGKQQGQDRSANQNLEGIFFLIFTVTTILNIAAIEDVYQTKRRFQMMRRGGVLGPLRFFIVRFFELLLSRLFLAGFVAAACRIMIPDVNIKVFVFSVGILSFAHYSLLFMCCMMSPESWLATSAIVIYTGYSLLFAGFFLNIETKGVKALSMGSIIRYAYGISVKTFIEDNRASAVAEVQLGKLGFSDDTMSYFVTVLMSVAAVAWLLIFIKLKWLS